MGTTSWGFGVSCGQVGHRCDFWVRLLCFSFVSGTVGMLACSDLFATRVMSFDSAAYPVTPSKG